MSHRLMWSSAKGSGIRSQSTPGATATACPGAGGGSASSSISLWYRGAGGAPAPIRSSRSERHVLQRPRDRRVDDADANLHDFRARPRVCADHPGDPLLRGLRPDLLAPLADRRMRLLQQREDIEIVLAEIDGIEREC